MSHPKNRTLSQFMFREMIYDYVSGQLDKNRKQAVEDYISVTPSAQAELEQLKKAISYSHQLAETKVSQPLIEEIKKGETYFSQLIESLHWRRWPEILKLSTQALAVSVAVAVVAMMLPLGEWVNDIKLATQKSFQSQPADKEPPILVAENSAKVSDDLTVEDEPGDTEVSEDELERESVETNVEVSNQSGATKQEGSAEQSQAKGQQSKSFKVIVAKSKKKDPNLKGFKYETRLEHPDPDSVGDALAETLKSMGAQKAGKVKLGWKKSASQNQRYYHFSLPESKYDDLINHISRLGPVRIYKVPHWRQMPKGKIRFIMNVVQPEDK